MKWNDAWLIRSFHMAKINRLHSVYMHPSSTIFYGLGHWGCSPTGESSLSAPSQSVQLFPGDPPDSHHSATPWPGFQVPGDLCLAQGHAFPLISLVKGDLWTVLSLSGSSSTTCLPWVTPGTWASRSWRSKIIIHSHHRHVFSCHCPPNPVLARVIAI